MDIDLLAKMVKELVMDHDSVTLPGMGSFVTELVPATFADRGYTIIPPYRRLYFSPKQRDDNWLAQLYAKSNNVSEADAYRILEDFIAEMKEVLKVRKTLVLTGLGRLRATRENHFFFVADEDLDIYPAGFGLQPISLKTHEETPEEVAAAVSNLAAAFEVEPEPVAEPEPEPEPVIEMEPVVEAEPEEPVTEPEPEPAPEEELPPIEIDDPLAVEAEVASLFSDKPIEKPVEQPVEQPAEEPVPVPEAIVHTRPKEWTQGAKQMGKKKHHKKKHSSLKTPGTILLILLIIVMLAVLALVVLGHFAPQWLDQFLYSAEELEILQ